MFNRDSKDTVIKFYSRIEGIYEYKDIWPYPASKYRPSWWTNTPNTSEVLENGPRTAQRPWPTVKRCPSVADFFGEGYIMPMWGNMRVEGYFTCDCEDCKGDGAIISNIDGPASHLPLTGHTNQSFLEYCKPVIGDRNVETTVKFQTPWHVITPKGWSTLVLPMFYEFNKNYTILPGVVDTDTFHQINHATLLHCKNEPFTIPAGEPLAMYIPFKRSKTNFEVIQKSVEMDNYIQGVMEDWSRKQETNDFSLFGFKNSYRKMQRERDSK